MRPDLLVLLVTGSGILSGGCLSRPPLVLETPEGRVVCEDQAAGERVAGALRQYGPRIRACLGSSREPPRVELWMDMPHGAGGFTHPEFIALNAAVTDQIESRTCHELVHWHSTENYRQLPYFASEGLAAALTTALEPRAPGILFPGVASPDAKGLERAFEITSGDLALARSDVFSNAAGEWMAAAIGWKRLRELCTRAAEEGLERVPEAWIRAELPALGQLIGMGDAWLDEGAPGLPAGTATVLVPQSPDGAMQ